jgi:class 3 adenylate cyclase
MKNQHATTMSKLNGRPKQTAACTACGYQNPDNATICLNCTAALENNCPICGHSAPVGAKFCGQCGAKLSPTGPEAGPVKAQRQALAPKTLVNKLKASGGSGEVFSENREVTLLHLSLVFSSATETGFDEEDIYFIQDDTLKRLAEIVKKYEGTLEKFTSNGLNAIFGAPVLHENDPERAVRAALEMQQLIQARQIQADPESGLNVSARFGLHTGTVVAGTVGNSNIHLDYTVVGNTVQVTQELEQSALAGDILISGDTYSQVRSMCKFTPLSPITQSEPPAVIQRFKVTGLVVSPELKTDPLMPQVSMIGRAKELEQLQTALATVVEQERSQVALITGEAGQGKSRLLAEFRQWADRPTVTFVQGTCLAYTRAIPFGVIANLLRKLIGITETNPATMQQQSVEYFLKTLLLPEEQEISPYLLHVLGLPQANPAHLARLEALDATMLQRQTHAALRQVFLALSRRQPAVLIFEDLQWVDTASRSFLEYLVNTTDEAPLLLLFISRAAERRTVLRSFVTQAAQHPEQWLDLRLSPLSHQENLATGRSTDCPFFR